MNEKDKPEKSDFRSECDKFGVNIPTPTICIVYNKLDRKHLAVV